MSYNGDLPWQHTHTLKAYFLCQADERTSPMIFTPLSPVRRSLKKLSYGYSERWAFTNIKQQMYYTTLLQKKQ